ncbi:MAG TPA: GNAT family N-acetyltransferase [Ramlibacter sp.]|uniref:GNAT family N-acetyltransferase n=1 Tax=Ramlibacter sp. TaxID=1917967 RepID=UPI002C34A246|nr:GNAT family N-acetyltransferase [Ramlibacter sp.]HVZ44797.1 GNAT family N-acetyltransferase [Ramlibacter sp.]
MTDAITVRRVAPGEAEGLIDALADLLIDCVEGGASVGFMLPITHERAARFWREVAGGVDRGERVLLVAHDAQGCLVGTVQLILSLPENQPHRADVAKMQVASRARRQGIAARLMTHVDEEARREGRTLLVLDAVTGGDAERVYERAGWTKVGSIPNYALYPGGGLCATTYMYKAL